METFLGFYGPMDVELLVDGHPVIGFDGGMGFHLEGNKLTVQLQSLARESNLAMLESVGKSVSVVHTTPDFSYTASFKVESMINVSVDWSLCGVPVFEYVLETGEVGLNYG